MDDRTRDWRENKGFASTRPNTLTTNSGQTENSVLALRHVIKGMGKGGCKAPPTTTADDDCVVVGLAETYDIILEKEREEKKAAEPKFYWADDEEPHRRR